MLDDRFRADLREMVTAFRQGGGALLVAMAALDDLSDEMYAEHVADDGLGFVEDPELEEG